ncbi:DUF2510 domain-containing protein [Nocardioides aurantiacus]|uniref:DUF2510 domain-containing protein n=1 Tax=Nocardioides aurantiacus TaxID=86796 RepID=UPI003CCC590B
MWSAGRLFRLVADVASIRAYRRGMSLPPAGWYNDPELVDTRRYWDGEAWTDHRVETPGAGRQQGPRRPCPYCATQMPLSASRCPACSGQLFYCHKDQEWVGAHHRQKWVGVARGGTLTQSRCMKCSKVVAGPRF